MYWDDPLFTGMHDGWHWIVVRAMIRELPQLVIDNHLGYRLAITSFDSGPISPTAEERELGWSLADEAMVSPPLTAATEIPCDNYDEWYLFENAPTSVAVSDRFVSFCGFTLANPQGLTSSQDPTWDPRNYDWLAPLQRQFWANLARLSPTTYVCSGDSDIVVTRSESFARAFTKVAREKVA